MEPTPRKMEWSLIIGAITTVLNLLVGFQFDWLSADQAALWVLGISAVAGVVVALKTRPIAPGAFTYAIGAGAALLGAYGLNFTQENVTLFSTAFVAVLALLMRGQVAPATDVKKGLVATDGVTVLVPPAAA